MKINVNQVLKTVRGKPLRLDAVSETDATFLDVVEIALSNDKDMNPVTRNKARKILGKMFADEVVEFTAEELEIMQKSVDNVLMPASSFTIQAIIEASKNATTDLPA